MFRKALVLSLCWALLWVGPAPAVTLGSGSSGSGSGGGSGGDASTDTSTSIDGEIVLFKDTTGKLLKRATTTGILKATSGVIGTVTGVTDDAQLKRAAGDWAGFSSKASPDASDLLLIEDSAAGGAKKKVLWSAIPVGGGGGGGTSVILDLGDNGSNESTAIAKIATTGDTNSIFSEPSADKLLIDLTKDWPKSDLADALAANGANCNTGSFPLGVDAAGAVESCSTLSAVNPQTSTYQVVAADFSGYKTISVASGTFTITLVASGSQPAAGQYITVVNYGSGVVTIARSGQNINGGTSSLTLPASSATDPSYTRIISDGTNYFAGMYGTVNTGKIADNAVTLAKMADMATASILGRNTAGTGDPEVLSAATTKGLLTLNNVDNTSDATKNAATATLTNKRIQKRALSQGDTSPIAINADNYDLVVVAELSQATTFNIPTGTPTEGDILWFLVKSTVARALTFTTGTNGFAASNSIALPTTTDAGSWVLYGFMWLATPAKWSFVSSTQTTTRGSAGQCYTSNGAGSEPSFQACGGGSGGTGFVNFPVGSPTFPTSNAAVVDNSENNTRLLFDASTQECVWWQFMMPPDYASAPVLKVLYSMTSATTGGVSIDVSVMATTPGDSADINTDSYATVNNCDDTSVPGTAGFLDTISCTLTNTDSVAAGDLTKIKLCRAPADSSDTASGDMEVVGVQLQYSR